MMIDYNVSDHWAVGTPAWLKSLVSSLDRGHGVSGVLPLTVIVGEIDEWVQLASGTDAWDRKPNRESLRLDLEQSKAAMGRSLRSKIAAPLAAFVEAFSCLCSCPRATLRTAPGTRTEAVWVDVATTATELLRVLATDAAAGASWDDLVAAAQIRSLERREYRPIVELLFEQIRRRGHDADRVFDQLVSMVAFGRDEGDWPFDEKDTPLHERLAKAKALVERPAGKEPIVIWLGYKGRIHQHLESGRVTFYDAVRAVPNIEPGRHGFAHEEELRELVQHGSAFDLAQRTDRESVVDTIVRVDLGTTVAAGALNRAEAIVDTILNVAIHRAGGIRPRLSEYHVLRSGAFSGGGHYAVHAETGFPDDTYGADITTDAIEQYAPRIAEALAREELPRFLAAAIELQTVADHPFSRDMALRRPSEADISSIIPLSDRVVQHVAAHASMGPTDLFSLLSGRWPHARWITDVRRAGDMCLLGGSKKPALQHELTAEWISTRPKHPWLLLLADRANEFLSLCRLEHERAWIERMFASISDHAMYSCLIADYTAEGHILEARRCRVRNALVHGNPASFPVVTSVREYAEFISRNALHLALESFIDGTNPACAFKALPGEYTAMQAGQDPASYWRARIADGGWPLSE